MRETSNINQHKIYVAVLMYEYHMKAIETTLHPRTTL